MTTPANPPADLAAWLDQQMENQRHTGNGLKLIAGALPSETGALLTQVGDFLIEDADAKRRILDWLERLDGWSDSNNAWSMPSITDVWEYLAEPYSDRPGFREEWKPT